MMDCRSRGDRVHKGLDIACADGSVVYAPFDVTLNGRVIVYTDPKKSAINNGINLRGGSTFSALRTGHGLRTTVISPLFSAPHPP